VGCCWAEELWGGVLGRELTRDELDSVRLTLAEDPLVPSTTNGERGGLWPYWTSWTNHTLSQYSSNEIEQWSSRLHYTVPTCTPPKSRVIISHLSLFKWLRAWFIYNTSSVEAQAHV
jgi:hypothetical protein